MNCSVGVAFITHNSAHHLPHCLPPILNSSVAPKVLVVISSDEDDSKTIAEGLGAETLLLSAKEYNHGLTRERARQYLGTDICVLMTPDAYAQPEMLKHLIAPIQSGYASIAYARQLPHKGADIFEAFPREYNYPAESQLRGLSDAASFGAQTFFCSNSCAAYEKKALDSIGGFRSVLLGEDTCATAELLRCGHRIAYVAEALVHHSHRYTLKQEFQRYFDTGLARNEYRDLLIGSDEKRGGQFLLAFMKKIVREAPLKLPYAFLHTLTKWLGYRIGKGSTSAPLFFKRALSSQKFYWDSNEFQRLQRKESP